jgi:hypothetical protein
MSTTLDEICSLLDSAKIRYGRREDRIRTGFETDLYEDRDGDNCLHMAIWPEDDGETLRVQAYGTYLLPPDQHAARLAAVQRTINQINWETKLAHFEMDIQDGEIRISVDIPLEDAQLTERQLVRAVKMLPDLADRCHLAMRQALEHGIPLATHEELCLQFDTFMIERDKGLGEA